MERELLEQRCRELLQLNDDEALNAQSLIGVFQRFRHQPNVFASLFGGTVVGQQIADRISKLMASCGPSQRQGGGQDAYFIVREIPVTDPQFVERQGTLWLNGLYALVQRRADDGDQSLPPARPSVRVLEGLPPKQMKSDEQAIPLLRWLKRDIGQVTERLVGDCAINELFRDACYFIACDAMLRDYVLWPTFGLTEPDEDPFSSYFELWRHGIKWRVFREDQVDLYLPRA